MKDIPESLTYALEDFLEMRAGLNGGERTYLLQLIQRHLDCSKEIRPFTAFMLGTQAVLCAGDSLPDSCWIFNRKIRKLQCWPLPRRISPEKQPCAKPELPALSESGRRPAEAC